MPVQISEQDKKQSDIIVQWLKSHPLINISGLCDYIGYNRRNFASVLNGDRYLPAKYQTRVIKVLKLYGYNQVLND